MVNRVFGVREEADRRKKKGKKIKVEGEHGDYFHQSVSLCFLSCDWLLSGSPRLAPPLRHAGESMSLYC